MKYFLLIVIVLCLIFLVKAGIEVRRWWRAWKLEEQKKKPVIKSIPINHVDKKI